MSELKQLVENFAISAVDQILMDAGYDTDEIARMSEEERIQEAEYALRNAAIKKTTV